LLGSTVPTHYRCDGDVAVLEIDNSPVNALSLEVRRGLMEGMNRAAADATVRAVVIIGANGSFPAGADIREIASGAAFEPPILLEVIARIESLGKPVVAAIDGVALGGGFELALACHARIAASGARVGLPEVKLGLIPGAGGTQRFTRLAGPQAALEAISTGEALPAARARTLGVIDALADALLPEALAWARRLADEGPGPLASEREEKVTGVDRQLFSAWRAAHERKFKGQLAPWRIADAIEAACTRGRAEAFALERRYYLECRESPQRKALMHVFDAERAARKIEGVGAQVEPLPIRRAAVGGGGTMGAGIAVLFATADIPVTLLDVSDAALAAAMERIRAVYAQTVERGRLSRAQADAALQRITGTTGYESLATADIAIEAVFEDPQLKRAVFEQLDRNLPAHAILATNTSTLDIDQLAQVTGRPQQVVGTHFFSPAHVMKLMENVRGAASSPQTLATVMALAKRLGKIPVMAGNCDGFIGNRMLLYYGVEAERLLEEGATPEQVDGVIEGFGFAMGPLAMRDLAGNDVGWAIRRNRTLPADERWSPILRRMAEEGRLGRKSGAGFYRYEGGKRRHNPEALALIESVSRELGIERRAIAEEEILARLLHPLINEGAKILAEGIASRSGDIDVVYIHGYGFPAYKGGPMYWGLQDGLEKVIATMERLARSHGARWAPAPRLLEAAARGRWD
jgi:3-hydroxyacyl-CoA dehydrogenase